MSEQPAIRWRESDIRLLRTAVRLYNTRLNKERKEFLANEERYKAAQLPNNVSVQEMRQSITTRKEFNQTVKQLEHYRKTGERFKLDKNTEKSLHATVRDVNKKIDRLQEQAKKKGLSGAQYPKKISANKLKELSKDKENVQRLIKDYKKFLHKGAEDLIELPNTQLNIKITKWQYYLMQEGIEEVNKNRALEREAKAQAEVKYGGKSAGYTQAQVGMDMQGELPDMQLYNKWTEYHDLDYKLQLIYRERQQGYWDAKTELARINYMQTVKDCLGNDPVGKRIIKEINKMPLEDFKRQLTEQQDLWELLYRFKEADNKARKEVLHLIWNEWFPDKDMDVWLAETEKNKAKREALKQKSTKKKR